MAFEVQFRLACRFTQPLCLAKAGIVGRERRWYSGAMTTKEQVLEAVHDLPADATFEDAMERLLFLAKIARGLQQADAGQTVPHAQVKQQMAKWLK